MRGQMMATVYLSMSGVVKQTKLHAYQIRHRMKMMGLKIKKLNQTQFMFTPADIRKIMNYNPDKK
jgi:hypothetical protein